MFEKEAEEYAEGTKTEKELEVLNIVHDWGQESLTPEERRLLEGIQDRERAREQGFKDGAEYSYNKANEWHYVKDGDLPKGEGAVLIYWKSGDMKCASVVEPYKVTEDTHIIAWKEIVLPELKESE